MGRSGEPLGKSGELRGKSWKLPGNLWIALKIQSERSSREVAEANRGSPGSFALGKSSQVWLAKFGLMKIKD